MSRATRSQNGRPPLDAAKRRLSTPRVESMPIERLTARLAAIWEHELGIVVAPPGSGKTTLLAMFAESVADPVAWIRCDRWDTTESALVRQLAEALEPWIDEAGDWTDVDDAMAGLSRWDPRRALIVIDDLHALDGSRAEVCLEQLLDHLPDGVHLLVASRTQPAFNLSRLRLSGDLLEIGADDLRLRTWEVERLFRDHYREPMAPEELARLAWWTHGWAAGLQLFHLATRGRPADERRRVLGSLGPRSRLARQYLAQNALDRVPDALRSFMVHTSVSSRLSGRICDRLLGRTGSARVLDELERRSLFTTRVDEAGNYRYHEVFRSHLQGVLMSEVGEDGARARFISAGDILMGEGTAAEALEAYVRAEAWEVVGRILAEQGPVIADEPFGWLGVRAVEPLVDDPWLALAGARRLRAEGRFGEAVKAFALLAADVRQIEPAAAAGRERAELLTWLQPGSGREPWPMTSFWAALRRAIAGSAIDVAEVADRGVNGQLMAALCSMVDGDLAAADRRLMALEKVSDAEGVAPCIGAMSRGAIALLGGDEEGIIGINGAIGAAEGQGFDWVARVGSALLALSGRLDYLHEAARLEDAARTFGDPWGAALACIGRAWGALVAACGSGPVSEQFEPVDLAESARRQFRALEAPVLEAWSASIAAVARVATGMDGRAEATAAEAFAGAIGADVPGLLARTALAQERGDGHETQRLAGQLQRCGWRVPLPAAPTVALPPVHVERGGTAVRSAAAAPVPPARLRLFGAFHLEIGGEAIDSQAIRSRVRTLLYLLALHADRPVHRETIMETLWPGAEPTAAARSLYVAVATLRRVLEPTASRRGFRFVPHEGDGYRLALPAGSLVDTIAFEEASAAAHAAHDRGRTDDVMRWCRVALENNRGELIPEAGPADWIDGPRESYRLEAVELATMLADTLSREGSYQAAASACLQGLVHDRFHDPLWRILIDAREADGDPAAADAARSRYRRALADLGLVASEGSSA